jgi:hypothetical protein
MCKSNYPMRVAKVVNDTSLFRSGKAQYHYYLIYEDEVILTVGLSMDSKSSFQ